MIITSRAPGYKNQWINVRKTTHGLKWSALLDGDNAARSNPDSTSLRFDKFSENRRTHARTVLSLFNYRAVFPVFYITSFVRDRLTVIAYTIYTSTLLPGAPGRYSSPSDSHV